MNKKGRKFSTHQNFSRKGEQAADRWQRCWHRIEQGQATTLATGLLLLALICLSAAFFHTANGWAEDAQTGNVFTVFVSPEGDDSGDGSLKNPVRTLKRAQEIVTEAAPDLPVEVRLDYGTYERETVQWTYYHPEHKTSFMPIDFNGSPPASRPVLDGLHSTPLAFDFKIRDGVSTNIHIYALVIRGYHSIGVRFWGNRNNEHMGWQGNNRIEFVRFEEIGNKWDPSYDHAVGAIDMFNCRNSIFARNEFIKLENAEKDGGYLHAFYASAYSHGNLFIDNHVEIVSGDPIRIRDYSNGNKIYGNTFVDAGKLFTYSDWYCDNQHAAEPCDKTECPSWRNRFYDNISIGGYQGVTVAPIGFLGYTGPEAEPDPWPAGCANHFEDDWKRVYTSAAETIDRRWWITTAH